MQMCPHGAMGVGLQRLFCGERTKDVLRARSKHLTRQIGLAGQNGVKGACRGNDWAVVVSTRYIFNVPVRSRWKHCLLCFSSTLFLGNSKETKMSRRSDVARPTYPNPVVLIAPKQHCAVHHAAPMHPPEPPRRALRRCLLYCDITLV
jgi:hypothetical protein